MAIVGRAFFTSILFALAASSLAHATTYYVDQKGGSDNNTGTTKAAAWKSLSKVNNASFSPGDSVLFRKGNIWNGTLSIHNAGKSGSPVTFASYGTGGKPLINGQGKVEATIFIENQASYVTIDGFRVTNYDGSDVFDGKEAKRSGIRSGKWGGKQKGIKILNNEVYWVEGCSNHNTVGSPRGTSLDPKEHHQYNNGGIFVNASSADGVIIEGNFIHDCTCAGINVFSYDQSHNLVVQSNAIHNVGSDGIELLNSMEPLVQLNSCIRAGNNSGTAARGKGVLGYRGLAVCGMWSYGSTSPVFQYNYCESTAVIKYDGQPWDFDIDTKGKAVYQYNYSRDNEGGFNLGGEKGHIFRYNISYNDGSGQGNGQGYFTNSPQYYNNVFYRDDGKGFLMSGSGTFKNNIFRTNATTNISYQGGGRVFTRNCFSGHTPIKPGSNPVKGNPLFVNPKSAGRIPPGKIITLEDLRKATAGFKLQTGSSCINKGIPLSNNGGRDFFANPLYEDEPDIGAHEFIPQKAGMIARRGDRAKVSTPAMGGRTLFVKRGIGLNIPGIKIWDIQGRVVYHAPKGDKGTRVDFRGGPGGTYFYTITRFRGRQQYGKLFVF